MSTLFLLFSLHICSLAHLFEYVEPFLYSFSLAWAQYMIFYVPLNHVIKDFIKNCCISTFWEIELKFSDVLLLCSYLVLVQQCSCPFSLIEQFEEHFLFFKSKIEEFSISTPGLLFVQRLFISASDSFPAAFLYKLFTSSDLTLQVMQSENLSNSSAFFQIFKLVSTDPVSLTSIYYNIFFSASNFLFFSPHFTLVRLAKDLFDLVYLSYFLNEIGGLCVWCKYVQIPIMTDYCQCSWFPSVYSLMVRSSY